MGKKGALLPSVCAVDFERLRRAGGSGAAAAAGPAGTALNRFFCLLQSGINECRELPV